jgi:hypothetical protein
VPCVDKKSNIDDPLYCKVLTGKIMLLLICVKQTYSFSQRTKTDLRCRSVVKHLQDPKSYSQHQGDKKTESQSKQMFLEMSPVPDKVCDLDSVIS